MEFEHTKACLMFNLRSPMKECIGNDSMSNLLSGKILLDFCASKVGTPQPEMPIAVTSEGSSSTC